MKVFLYCADSNYDVLEIKSADDWHSWTRELRERCKCDVEPDITPSSYPCLIFAEREMTWVDDNGTSPPNVVSCMAFYDYSIMLEGNAMPDRVLDPPTDRASLVKFLSGTSLQTGDRSGIKMDPVMADAALRVLDAAGLAVVPKRPTSEQTRAGADANSFLSSEAAGDVYCAAVKHTPFAS